MINQKPKEETKQTKEMNWNAKAKKWDLSKAYPFDEKPKSLQIFTK